MSLESNVVSKIVRFLESLPNCAVEKTHGSALSSGKADLNACYKGRFLRLEVKTSDHGNTASKKQLINLRRWENAGAVCGVVYSVEEVKSLISRLEDNNYGN